MYRPGDTINERLSLDQSPDAAPVVRVFRNGLRFTTVTLTGIATGYLVSYLIPSAWATTDYVQVVSYPLFGGQQYATELFAGRLGTEGIFDSATTVSSALVCDQVPDATPSLATYLDGVASGATISISATAEPTEYTITVNPLSLTTGVHLSVVALPVFGGQTYSVELWNLDLRTAATNLLVTGEDGLIHSPAEIVRQVLIDGAVLTATGTWPVWASNEHDTPDESVTVYDTVGTEDGRAMTDGTFYAHYGIMIRVRSQTHAEGVVKAAEIRQFLSRTVRNRLVTVPTSGSRTGATYLINAVTKIGQLTYLGSDVPSSRRKLFTLNATVALRRVT